jgi:hypothetical protein
MWLVVEEIRQCRRDFLVEVRVGGAWYLAHTLEWFRTHTMGGTARVGDYVRFR